MDLKQARIEVADKITECCSTVLEWQRTGVCPEGNFRRIAADHCDGDIRLLENEVTKIAMRIIADMGQSR